MQQVLGRRGQCHSRKMLLFQLHLPCSHISPVEGYRAQICVRCLVSCLSGVFVFFLVGVSAHPLSTQRPLLYLGSDS